ncbi:subtilase family protein, partial [Genlisea aurea]
YIVYLGEHSHGPEIDSQDLHRVAESHTLFLASHLGRSEEEARESLIYSYDKSFNGFAALLHENEVEKIRDHPDVVSIFSDKPRKLHTTHSWDFLRLETNDFVSSSSLWERAKYGEDIILANLDTGVWPESKCFSGEGYGPVPTQWRGTTCQLEDRSLCNRKLLGAAYYNKGYLAYTRQSGNSPVFNTSRDNEGHGSHTLSTAAGNFVSGASVFGVGNGTAKGGAPKARVASYKVCWPPLEDGSECFDSDITKGFDAAIYDGVDVVSISLGGDPSDYFNDGIAIAALHAVRRGIVVVCSAGNGGPTPGTVSNVAPWIITVAASTLDREFRTDARLRSGEIFHGESLTKAMPQGKLYRLIDAGEAAAPGINSTDSLLCKNNTLDPRKVKGKIVVCLRGDNARLEKGAVVARAGGAGMILCNDKADGSEIIADPHLLPATHINYTDGLKLFSYLNENRKPRGVISSPTAVVGVKPAPFMAAFSSRGPNTITPSILKPDITAPGVNIIAAYTENASPSGMEFDHRKTPFITESGTSMSCPHVAGVTALLRRLHPDWSPAAIKSAIMTTARTRDNNGRAMIDGATETGATPLAYGAGHIRPNRAMDPGLVYDLDSDDYLDFLCGSGYNETMIKRFSRTHYACPKEYNMLNFNYPSITIPAISGESVTVVRKLKNVGKPGKYGAVIRPPPGYTAKVEPDNLSFGKIGEEKSFKVT